MYGQISCICLHANEGPESKTKDSMYNTHLNFRTFFRGKKVRIYTGKYGTLSVVSYMSPLTNNSSRTLVLID